MSPPSYRDDRGEPVDLGAELGAGGEGSVFEVRGKGASCAKIYRADKASLREPKIRAMLANKPSWLLRRSIAWPSAPLYGGPGKGSFAGFIMPRRRGMMELYRLIVPDERMAVAGFLDARDLCLIAARVARLVEGVHRAGHAIGDLKPQNILVAPGSGEVALIDTDSFHIHDSATGAAYPTEVVTPEYTAPELTSARAPRTQASDGFALAVLIHQIVLGGAHPFEGELARSGKGSDDRIPGRIRRGLCPLVPGVEGIRPAKGALSTAILPSDVRALFVRAFGQGPLERPSAKEWRVALDRAAGAMIRCAVIPTHRYDRGLSSCPWCARKAERGLDPFAPDQRWQRALLERGDLVSAPEPERTAWMRRHIEIRLDRGSVTAAERAFLEKTGASLGFDKARIGHLIALGREPKPTFHERLPLRDWVARARRMKPRWRLPSWRPRPFSLKVPRGLGVAVAALSITTGSAAAFALTLLRPKARAVEVEGSERNGCVAMARDATIGNTKGRGAFLRAAPSPASERLALPEGTEVKLLGRTEAAGDRVWSEVFVPSMGRAGWVASQYLVVR